jgi:UDP-glucuronate 4-epimerase
MVIHSFTDKISRGEEIEVFAGGKTRRDYTYIDDIIDGTMRSRTADYDYEIVNLGRSDTVVLSDLVNKIETALGKKARIKVSPAQPGDVEQTFADISKARRLLNFDPQTSIDDGLHRFIDWYTAQRGTQ